jgi:hypothetical protein
MVRGGDAWCVVNGAAGRRERWLPGAAPLIWLYLYLLRHQKRWLKRSARPIRRAEEPTWLGSGLGLGLGLGLGPGPYAVLRSRPG